MKYVYLKFPTTEEILFSNRSYEKSLKYFRENDFLSKAEIEFYLKKYEIFPSEFEEEVISLETNEAIQYPSLPNFESSNELNRYLENCMIEVIHGYKKIEVHDLFKQGEKNEVPVLARYKELTTIKSSYTKNSAESLAEMVRLNYLTYFCVYKDKSDKLWKSYKDFVNDSRSLLVRALQFQLVSFLSGLDQTTIRRLARHTIWRTKWIGATKANANLFPGNISEWDLNKTTLVFWSSFYDNIYGSSNVPEQFIIEDDKLLDSWLENENRKNKSGSTSDSADKDTNVAIFKTKIAPVKKRN